MATEKIGISVEAEIDQKSFSDAEEEVKVFARDTKKELDKNLLLDLQINRANLSIELEQARSLLRKAKKENDQDSIINLTLKTEELRSNLTEAGRVLQNYRNTGEVAVSRLQAKFNQVTDEIKKSRDELINLGKSTTSLDGLLKKADDLQKEFASGKIPVEEFTTKLGEISSQGQKTQGVLANIGAGIGDIAKGAVGFFALDSIVGFIGNVINLGKQAEVTQVVFKNLTGSIQEANIILDEARKFAEKTPFSFNEITDAEKKLISIAGVARNDLIPTLTALGDIASSQGKPLEQAVEAFNDAIVGEFERLKEFGIRASSEGDKVTFAFKGQKTTVEKTQEAISGYIKSLGEAKGVAGSMEEQSKTLTGVTSAFNDKMTNLWTTIALKLLPIFKDFIIVLNSIIKYGILGADVLGKGMTTALQFLLLGLTATSEAIFNFGKNIYEVFGVSARNSVKIFKWLGENIGVVAKNIPILFGIGLDALTKKIDSFVNSSIDKFNSISETLGGPKIGKVDFKTNLGGSLNELTQLQGLEDVQIKGNFNVTKKGVDQVSKSINELKKSYQELIKKENESVSVGGGDKGKKSTKIIETLDSLNGKLQQSKKDLQKLEIGSKEFIAKQKEIAEIQEKIDKAEGKTQKGKVKTAEEVQKELDKKREEEIQKEIKAQEERLKLQAKNKVEEINQSSKSESEKAKEILAINENLESNIKKLKQTSLDIQLENAKKIVEKEKENNKEKIKTIDDLDKAYKKSSDIFKEQIDKSKDKAKEFTEKIKDLKDEIKDLNKELSDLDSERASTLGERNVEILKRQAEIQKELNTAKKEGVDLSFAESLGAGTLEQLGNAEIGGTTADKLLDVLKLQKEYNDLKKEQIEIQSNATQKELDEAKRISELSPTAKFLEENKKKREEIQKEFLLKQGLSEQEIQDEIAKQGSIDEVVKTYNEKKLLDLEAQKTKEEEIIQRFTNNQAIIDENYKNLKMKFEKEITDNLYMEAQKRASILDGLRLKINETAEALRSAGLSSGTASENTSNNTTISPNITINGATDVKAVAKEVEKVIIKSSKNALNNNF